jgi:hypothetical protein
MRAALAEHAALLAAIAGVIVVFLLAAVMFWRRRRAPPAQPMRDVKAAVVSAAVAPSPALSAWEVERKLRQAEERSAKDELPGLYLMLAHCRMTDGAKSQAEDLLRKSLRVSAGARFKDVQAKARVALGDLAFESGDRSTACEHWQIARALFHELKQTGEHAAVEGRMLKNGCPTDWVLTDF